MDYIFWQSIRQGHLLWMENGERGGCVVIDERDGIKIIISEYDISNDRTTVQCFRCPFEIHNHKF